MDDRRRQEPVEATLAALEHTVGRVGPVTFRELAEALAAVDVSGRSREWREEWTEIVDALRRAAEPR